MTTARKAIVLFVAAALVLVPLSNKCCYAGASWSGPLQFHWEPGDTTTTFSQDYTIGSDGFSTVHATLDDDDPYVWMSFSPDELTTYMPAENGQRTTVYYRSKVTDPSFITPVILPTPHKSFLPPWRSPDDTYNVQSGYWPAGSDTPQWHTTAGLHVWSGFDDANGIGIGTHFISQTDFAWLQDSQWFGAGPPRGDGLPEANTFLFDDVDNSTICSLEHGVVASVTPTAIANGITKSSDTRHGYEGNRSLLVPSSIGETLTIDNDAIGSSSDAINIEMTVSFYRGVGEGTLLEKPGEYSIAFDYQQKRYVATIFDSEGDDHSIISSSFYGDSPEWTDLGFYWDGHVGGLMVNGQLTSTAFQWDFEKAVTDSDLRILSADKPYVIDELRISNEVMYYDQMRYEGTLKEVVMPGSAHYSNGPPIIVEADWLTLGDNGAFRDTATGLTWLDATVMQGRSYNETLAMMEPGGILDGWRHATLEEFETLMQDAGVRYGENPEASDEGLAFAEMAMSGSNSRATLIYSTSNLYVIRWITGTQTGAESRHVCDSFFTLGPEDSAYGGYWLEDWRGPLTVDDDRADFARAHALVRVVPEPSGFLLLAIGVVVLAGRGRRRRRQTA